MNRLFSINFRKKWYSLSIFCLSVISGFLLNSCSDESDAQQQEPVKFDPAFKDHIAAYTSGAVASGTNIKIRFSKTPADSVTPGKPVNKNLFSFTPSIKGKATWEDQHTIVFKPQNRLPNGKQFTAAFKMDKVFNVKKKKLETFKFSFNIINQYFEISYQGLEAVDKKDFRKQRLSGNIQTADYARPGNVEKMLTASQNGKALSIKWKHTNSNKHHTFTIKGIERTKQESSVKLNVTGAPIGLEREFEKDYEVPAIDNFKLTDYEVVQDQKQHVRLHFSDPVKEDQNLEGLIHISGNPDLNYVVDHNDIKIYAENRISGTKEVHISPGIQNTLGYEYGEHKTLQLTFEQVKPEVKLRGDGNIIPGDGELKLPFKAVNLRAVDVKIIKIYQNNISQFLQVNDLDGDDELHRVGRPVVEKTISLESSGVVNFGKWNSYSLDLSKLINQAPGAIYQVKIGFRKQHSTYHCPGDDTSGSAPENIPGQDWSTEEEFWEEDFDDYYYYERDYSERDNPCNGAYYGSKNTVEHNILSSDLGLMVKKGQHSKLHAFVTNLNSTDPVSGVTLKAYNYQQQEIASATTDAQGKAVMNPDEDPFLLIAENGQQRGYLKLTNGDANSLSSFNVEGQEVKEGLKGFLYGERGVWRPGDSLFISFILEDEKQTIPEGHPIIFKLKNPKGRITDRIVQSRASREIYSFKTSTGEDAPTGDWQAVVQVGGTSFSKTIPIETIKPNRLKMDLDFGLDKITPANANPLKGDLQINWLHGATAKNLKTEWEVYLKRSNTSFEDFPGFAFDDPSKRFETEKQTIHEGRTDSEGKATIKTDLSISNDAPGMLEARFKGKTYEQGGNVSVTRFSLPYYPYETFTGLKIPDAQDDDERLSSDKKHEVQVLSLNSNGEPVAGKEVNVKVYKLEWRWWWDDSGRDLSSYMKKHSHRQKMEGTVTTNSDGKGSWEMDFKDDKWGRYFVRACNKSSGHCTGKIIYLKWPWSRDHENMPGSARRLTFSAEKDEYEAGEEVTLNIPTSKGRALISIENGSDVLKTEWIKTSEGMTSYSFTTNKNMAPNIYAHVSLLQPHGQTKNDLPIRMYGVTPIKIEAPSTRLHPQIDAKEEFKPNSTARISVSEKNGKAMQYTLAVVGRGLLDITNFQTPAALEQLLRKRSPGRKHLGPL